MDVLDIARWQFGITTVYHFLMVPLTLGLGLMVAIMQTRWVRTGDEKFLRMTKFWGKVYLINFIVGVATGLVQEFQFGMAWSEYSRFVGDVFGAPLAMEGLLAFFVESTFLGIWIFGWGRLRKGLHLAALWCAVIGSWISAFFIIVANSWMQHPVGVELGDDGRPVMTDVWAVLTNNTALAAYTHTILGALVVAGMFLLGISWYHLWRRRHDGIDTVDDAGNVVVGEAQGVPGRDRTDHGVWIWSLRVGAIVAIAGFLGTVVTGDIQGKLMYEQQPMKMAAAEAACHTGSSFSVLSLGDPGSTDCSDVVTLIEIPGVLGFLGTGEWGADMPGISDLEPTYIDQYGATIPDDELYGIHAGAEVNYVPVMWVTYWGFRLMIGLGGIVALGGVVALWLTRRGTVPRSPWIMRLALLGIVAPFAANIAGWIFTELGRQPFVVAPNPDPTGVDGVFMFTAAAVSPGVTAGEMLFSVITLTLVYGIMLVIEGYLMVKYIRGGVAASMPELAAGDGHGDDPDGDEKRDDVLAFAY
ncbi:cytochrome ubiquinol oxidase subunit I [Microbacterium esteraromaticum]|uniref:cytochrome ubiquinol oxidase subunit I n=1 Tax=Microbacterium TaxID=33882 RepID=UPI0015C95F94|nr:cytochrome ubiquinol oxidase subunit I [Microbacterium esteraromaticum]MBN7793178.1 cytochrome ubiquinol oxidase subunit I [Microbacterium esteraromaticum]MBN8423962.1 cytochrome ubiquinol oxidase subunit I [Microbacterium esteraromaticum]MCA1305701.1 cytochrome ubiquinol oxidase subunit I [Microbacterium esteraromaticum]WDH79669.1 cytochrome ubiquinol oxidase subunit I [Microbacterium esteraromaticum]